MLVGAVQSKLDSSLNAISEDGVKLRFHIFFLVVSVGFEPTSLVSQGNTLAGCRYKPLIQLTVIKIRININTFFTI
jgi:hypothetical protein